MRWGGLVSTIVMATASTMLPRLLFKSGGIDTAGLNAMVAELQKTAAQKNAQPASGAGGTLGALETAASGQGRENQINAAMQALQTGAPVEGAADPAQAAQQSAMAQALLQGMASQGGPGLAGMLGQLQKAASGPREEDVLKQVQAIRSGQTDNVSLEQLSAVQDAAQSGTAAPAAGSRRPPGQAEMALALMNALKNPQPLSGKWKGDLLRDAEPVRRLYHQYRLKAQAGMIAAAGAVLVVAFLGAISFFRGLARFVLGMVFGLSGKFLILLSLSLAGFFAASQLNPWPLLPPEVLAAPVGYMLLSGLFLRLLDQNYPVWNTMFKSMAAPMVCCLGILGWIKYKPAVDAALAARSQG